VDWLSLLGIAVGLAMDALAVSIVAGMTVPRVTPRHTFRIGFHFGLFQFLMPVIGWFAGRQFAGVVADYDHWVAFVLLAAIGGKMLCESCKEQKTMKHDPTRGWTLVALSVATSIDALVVGVTMALVGASSVWVAAVVIGLVAAAFSTFGIMCGARLGRRWSRWSEVIGGCVLISIGVKVLVTHLFLM
jgi:putative Mn2+ efflux pump MntP